MSGSGDKQYDYLHGFGTLFRVSLHTDERIALSIHGLGSNGEGVGLRAPSLYTL